MSTDSKKAKIWQPRWWLPNLKKCDRQDSCQRVAESSAPKPTYYVLIVLSTLIASYGLLSNSTATVIGAMIVAPLMGPILGLALGTVLADTRMFRRSLVAESTGAVLVILTGLLVALVVGPDHIDFGSSEIAGRTRPTLYDLAIGIAAGLAGAYCTVHPGLQASVAGVAIAVALVPPLAVTGLTSSGWLHGNIGFRPVFGSFMLFFTNLLTIELASGAVFYGTGFRQNRADNPKAVWRNTLLVKLVLLLLTGWFLTIQLTNLLRERYGLATSRTQLEQALKDIPGAQLDTIEASLHGDNLIISAVVGSRTEIEPPTVAILEKRLSKELKTGLPDVEVSLVIRTVNSIFASSKGYLFEPTKTGLSDEERRQQTLDLTLREILDKFPAVDLLDFVPGGGDSVAQNHRKTALTVTLSTPYVFGPRFVEDLEGQLNDVLSKDPLFVGYDYSLLVKSVIIRNATSRDAVAVEAPEMRSQEEQELARREERFRQLLKSSLEINGDLEVTELHLRRAKVAETSATETTAVSPVPSPSPSFSPLPSPTPVVTPQSEPEIETDAYEVRLDIRSPKLIGPKILMEARRKAEEVYFQETGRKVQLSLDTTTTVGNDLVLDFETPLIDEAQSEDQTTKEERLNNQLNTQLGKLVSEEKGATLTGITGLQRVGSGEDYRMFAVVTSEKPISNKTVLGWQKKLMTKTPEISSLEIQMENRLGRTIKLTPSRR